MGCRSNQGKGAKSSKLQAQGFYKDKDNLEDLDSLQGPNTGLAMRFTRIMSDTDKPQLCDLEGSLLLDLCQQHIPLPRLVCTLCIMCIALTLNKVNSSVTASIALFTLHPVFCWIQRPPLHCRIGMRCIGISHFLRIGAI